LPREAIFEHRRKGTPLVEVIEELRENYLESPFGGGFSSTYGPVPNAVERHHPPAPDDAARMAASRFDLLFELLVDEESAP
jgi:hypothetical protein